MLTHAARPTATCTRHSTAGGGSKLGLSFMEELVSWDRCVTFIQGFFIQIRQEQPWRKLCRSMKDRVRDLAVPARAPETCTIAPTTSFSKNATEWKLRADLDQMYACRRASTNTVPAAVKVRLRATFGRILNASLPPFWAEKTQRVMQQSFLQHSLCCSNLFCI